MLIHTSPQVRDVVALYGDLLGPDAWSRRVGQQLRLLAQRLNSGHRACHPGALVELSNWHPALIVKPADVVWSTTLDEHDCLLTVARGHGYADWTAAEAAAATMPSESFERGIEAVLNGDLDSLRVQLTREPRLAMQRSHWGHRSSLLHYLAANGVEIYRQRVPHNAPEIARCLLAHGADVKAQADMYGGGQMVLGLRMHPSESILRAGAS